jgi:hypothetical protein
MYVGLSQNDQEDQAEDRVADLQGERHCWPGRRAVTSLAPPATVHDGPALGLHAALASTRYGQPMPLPNFDRIRLVKHWSDQDDPASAPYPRPPENRQTRPQGNLAKEKAPVAERLEGDRPVGAE